MDATAPELVPLNMGGALNQPALSPDGSRIVVTPLEKRLKAYKLFQELSARGTSTREMVCTVSRRSGVSRSAVYTWTKGTSPFGKRCGRVIRTKELFYVIGALLGDGCIYRWKNHYQIWLLGEKEFCTKYAKRVSACTSHTTAKPYPYRGRNVWFVHFQCAELYFLIKEIREQLRILTKLLRRGRRSVNALQLIEGFFDAEGCVKVIKEKVRRTPKINLDICNTNRALLLLIGRELKSTLGVEARFTSQWISPDRKVSHHLRIYKKSAIRKFLLHVPTIKLKPEKERYVENWLGKNR